MRMSELFSCLKEQVIGYGDMLAEHLLDECIELWASMLKASARKGRASIFPLPCCCMRLQWGLTHVVVCCTANGSR